MRTIIASEDLAPLIDRGADVDIEIKNLTNEDKGIKTKLVASLSSEIGEDESSVKVEGNMATATITAAEKATIRVGSEQYSALRKSVVDGLLPSVVLARSLVVPPVEIDKAVEALKAAGIGAVVSESMSVKAEDVRKMRQSEVASQEEGTARKALEDCLEMDISYRVKYGKK